MSTTLSRSNIIYPSLAILLLALAFPQYQILRTLFLTPVYLSATLFVLIAVVVLLAITSDSTSYDESTSNANRIQHAIRPLRFTTPAAWSAVLTRQSWEESAKPFATINTLASHALDSRVDRFLALIRQHFILPWYTRISPSPAFPHAVEGLIRNVMIDFTERAQSVDWSSVMVSRIVPLVTDHLQHYRSIEHLSSSSAGPSPNPALPLPLPRKSHPAFSAQSYTASGVSPSLEAHFRQTLERVLSLALPAKDQSEVVSTIIREIVLGTILLPVFDIMCDADFWNRQIDEKGGQYLREQKQVDKFLSALSALPAPSASTTTSPMPTSKRRSQKTPTKASSSSVSADSSSKQFDSFLKSISKLKTLGEARRLRADVERELRGARSVLMNEDIVGQNGKDGEKKLRRAEKYALRLEQAKVDIDAKITSFTGQDGNHNHHPERSPTNANILGSSSYDSVTLYSIVSDPSSLAYWLEHMDRRGRSRLVQYWLTVEGFKDPLEAAGIDSALTSSVQIANQTTSSPTQTIGEDVAFLYEMYFAAGQSIIDIPSKYRQIIEDTAQSGNLNLNEPNVQRVKHAIFASQKEVYEQMVEEDWPAFKRSELFIKAMTDLRRARVPLPVEAPAPVHLQQSPTITLSTPHPHRPSARPPTTPADSSRSLLDLLSPVTRPRLANKRGSFSPVMPISPTASVSITPPIFERMHTDSNKAHVKEARKVSVTDVDRVFSVESSEPSTPPPNNRKSSHLDFLIFGEEVKETEERERLFSDDDGVDEADEAYVEAQRMEAIQAALNEIIASDDLTSSRLVEQDDNRRPPMQPRSPSASLFLFDKTPKIVEPLPKLTSRSVEDLKNPRPSKGSSSAPQSRLPSVALPGTRKVQRRRSTPRLSLSPAKQTKHLFDDEPINEDEIEGDDQEEEPTEAYDIIQLAAPGDLQLSVEIARLQDKIQELVQQDHLLDTLIRQAELTGNQNELRILSRSQSSVRREQRTAIFQKAQFEQQEEENRLVPGRTKVTIPSSVITADDRENGKQVVRYTIEVSQVGEDGVTVLGWVVTRRYNEFWELDRSLRDWASGIEGNQQLMNDLKSKVADMPGKKLVPNMSSSFVESRRTGLERYLQSLLTSSSLCDSNLLRSFLSRAPVSLTGSSDPMASSTASLASLAPHNIVKSLCKTMATSLDDALLAPSMLDMMYNTLSRQLNDFGGLVGLGGEDLAGLLPSALKAGAYTPHWLKNDPIDSAALSTGSKDGPIQPMGGESGMTSFTAPICDLFIEVFDLKENNWLRRQAIVVILQQFLGSTIERKVRDSFRQGTSPESIEKTIASLEEILFPGGARRPPGIARTEAEKAETKIRASKKLGMLIPDVAANMIGRGNARRAARRVFGALQDTRLNQHLIISIIDEILNAIFPPAK